MNRFIVKPCSKIGHSDFLSLIKESSKKDSECNKGATVPLSNKSQKQRPQPAQPTLSVPNHQHNQTIVRAEKNDKSFNHLTSSSSQPNSIADEWRRRTGNVVTSLDITCQSQLEQMKAKNYVGWKADETGAKVYTTFRNGQRVTAGGQEGFKLFCGDSKAAAGKGKGQKRKAEGDGEEQPTKK